MDKAGQFRKDLLLGLMGIEVLEQCGGQAGSFFHAVLAVEGLGGDNGDPTGESRLE